MVYYVVYALRAKFCTLFQLTYPHFEILDVCYPCMEVFN